MHITEADRESARAAREARPKMTESAKAALRARNEHERASKLADDKFVATFNRVPKDMTAMRYVLRTIFVEPAPTLEVLFTGDDYVLRELPRDPKMKLPYFIEHLTRVALKLLSQLDAGLRPTSPSDVVLMATLTPNEEKMTDPQFDAELIKHAAVYSRSKQKTEKRQRASRKAKDLVWGASSSQIMPGRKHLESTV